MTSPDPNPLVALTALGCVLAAGPAHAQSTGEQPLAGKESVSAGQGSRFVYSATLLTATTPVRIESLTIEASENLLVEDLDVQVGDVADISSQTFMASVAFYPLPLLELSAGTGIVSSQSEAEIGISGSFVDPLPILGDRFSIVSDTERDNSGYSYTGGLAVLVPIVRDPDAPLVLRVGAMYGFNDLDNIETETLSSSLTLAHIRSVYGRRMTFALGVSHIDIDRVVEFSSTLGGNDLRLRQVQRIDDPWSLSTSFAVPVDDTLTVSIAASNNFSGMYSLAGRLSVRF
ncbi:MAG: hypothetical protein AAGA41_01170 [Pseudomonadota bacterium]